MKTKRNPAGCSPNLQLANNHNGTDKPAMAAHAGRLLQLPAPTEDDLYEVAVPDEGNEAAWLGLYIDPAGRYFRRQITGLSAAEKQAGSPFLPVENLAKALEIAGQVVASGECCLCRLDELLLDARRELARLQEIEWLSLGDAGTAAQPAKGGA